MINKRSDIISTIMENIVFSDGKTVKSRASKFIFKDNSFGCSIDVTDISRQEATKIQQEIMEILKQEIPDLQSNIILTSKVTKSEAKVNNRLFLENVKKVVLIASGKGGVGKSTITALLAYKLSAEGKRVGIVDADIYGPSIPHIFGINAKPEVVDKKMIPLIKDNIQINSIGLISAPKTSISWRGPMASKALYQLLSLTKWDNLDYLLIDSPPGTGDIHLSLLENYNVDEVLMITTPQQVAAIDVHRAINLYSKFDVKISGIIENMSYFISPEKQKIEIFKGQAGQNIAKEFNIPLLYQIPILPDLSDYCDKGADLSKFINFLRVD